MNRLARLAIVPLLAAASLLAQPGPAQAGIIPGWPGAYQAFLYRPDLRVVTAYPSPLSGHMRAVIINSGKATSAPCQVLAMDYAGTWKWSLATVPSLSPGQVVVRDIPYFPLMNVPGSTTQVTVDILNDVHESNESNNGYFYISPPA